jgi:DNA-binding MarR family transcriptional regulator
LQAHLLDPAEVKGVTFSGACARTRWRQTRRGAVIELTVKGRAIVEAKL